MRSLTTAERVYRPVRLLEAEYERMIPRFAERLTHRWNWADWKPMLEGPYGRVKPDVALIAKDCSQWCVVEIELARHPESHFRSQFERLAAAHYEPYLLPSLAKSFPKLPPTDLARLLREEQPTMLCIADDVSQPLILAARDFGFELAVGSPLRAQDGSYAVEWSRTPTVLREVDPQSAVEYLLVVQSGWVGGRLSVTLPRQFPKLGGFTLRVGDVHYPSTVRPGKDTRAFFLPSGVGESPGVALLLRPIDPANALYELVNGAVSE